MSLQVWKLNFISSLRGWWSPGELILTGLACGHVIQSWLLAFSCQRGIGSGRDVGVGVPLRKRGLGKRGLGLCCCRPEKRGLAGQERSCLRSQRDFEAPVFRALLCVSCLLPFSSSDIPRSLPSLSSLSKCTPIYLPPSHYPLVTTSLKSRYFNQLLHTCYLHKKLIIFLSDHNLFVEKIFLKFTRKY